MLGLDPGVEVVGQAANGREAVELAKRLQPDVVLMDLRMPELDGIGATGEITGDPAHAATRVLVLTTFENDVNVVAALRAGASGFIGKGAEPEDLVRAVKAIAAGDSLLSPEATRALIGRVTHPAGERPAPRPDGALLSALTEREREVLALVAKGLSNQQIAERLFISVHTTKTHVGNTMVKLGAHDRAQLVIAAYEGGLVAIGS